MRSNYNRNEHNSMIKSLLGVKKKSFKEKFVEAATASGGGRKASLDMTYGMVCILSKMLHRLYKDFLKNDLNEKAARSVATIASIIALSMEQELEAFGIMVDSEQAILTATILILTSIFKRSQAEVDTYYRAGSNAYKVILSNYGKSESVKSYFNDVHAMTINYIETLDDQYLESCKPLVIK